MACTDCVNGSTWNGQECEKCGPLRVIGWNMMECCRYCGVWWLGSRLLCADFAGNNKGLGAVHHQPCCRALA